MTINLSNLNYIELIDDYLSEPSRITDERKKELKLIVKEQDKFPFDVNITLEQKKKVLKVLDQLIDTKPGSELFERIISHGKPIGIALGKCYGASSVKISISFATIFCAGIDKDEKMRVFKTKMFFAIAHEFIHVLQSLEKAKFPMSAKLLHPHYDNLREQHAITGLFETSNGWSFDPLCENTFLIAMRFNGFNFYRVLHRGLNFEKKPAIPTLSDQICLLTSAPSSVRLLIEAAPDALNQEHYLSFKDINKSIRPLSAAIHTKNWEVFNFLLEQKNLELNYKDDFSSPFFQLLDQNEYGKLLQLTQHFKFDMHHRDENGITPLLILANYLLTCQPDSREQQLLEQILQIGCENIDLENYTYPNGADLLSCLALTGFLKPFLASRGIIVTNELLVKGSPHYIRILNELCEQTIPSRFKKICDILCLQLALPTSIELKDKILKSLAEAVVYSNYEWEDDLVKKYLELLIHLGGKIKKEYEQTVFNAINLLPTNTDLPILDSVDFLVLEDPK